MPPTLLSDSSPANWQSWTPAQKQQFASHLRAERARRVTAKWPTPGALATELDPSTINPPHLQLLDEALVDVAEGRCKRLIVVMPPQEGKSERTSHYGALWMLTRNPDLRIAIGSYGDTVARRFGQLIRNDVRVYPQLALSLREDSRAAGNWNVSRPHTGSVYCVGIGGSLTSRPVDVMFIDDPVKDREQADSETYRKNVWDWWTDVVRPRLAPDAPVVLIQTRWHEDDLAGKLIAQGGWRVIHIPAQADHKPEKGETDVLGRQVGEYLDSARRWETGRWDDVKLDVGSRTWTALYQGRPSPDSGDVWQRNWWRRYTTPIWSIDPGDGSYRVLDEGFQLIQSWDMAFKNTKASDWVVGQVWAQRGADAWLLDQVRKRLTFTETIAEFRRLTLKWPQASMKLVEDKANGTAVIDSLKSEIPGIVPVNPTDSKYGRAVAVAPFIEAGNAQIPDSLVALFDVDEFVDEAATFPNGAHDDQVDTTSQALNRLLLTKKHRGARMSFAGRASRPSQPTAANVA